MNWTNEALKTVSSKTVAQLRQEIKPFILNDFKGWKRQDFEEVWLSIYGKRS